MSNGSDSTAKDDAAPRSHRVAAGASEPSSASASPESEQDAALAEKQQMIEKLFRHTNEFLAQNKHQPLLVVEALAAIVVRYAALFGPVEQIKDRLNVLEHVIGQESAQIQEIAKSANWPRRGQS
jgi:hypothetical protein